MKKLFAIAFASFLFANAFAANEAKSDTLVVTTTPVMHCKNCENRIKQNVRFVKGTKKIETSVPQQTVTIIYDGTKATYADFQAAFKKIGFDIQRAGTKHKQ